MLVQCPIDKFLTHNFPMHDNSHLSPQVRNMKTSTLAQACSIALVCVQAIDMLLLLWLLYRLSWGFGRLGCGRLHDRDLCRKKPGTLTLPVGAQSDRRIGERVCVLLHASLLHRSHVHGLEN